MVPRWRVARRTSARGCTRAEAVDPHRTARRAVRSTGRHRCDWARGYAPRGGRAAKKAPVDRPRARDSPLHGGSPRDDFSHGFQVFAIDGNRSGATRVGAGVPGLGAAPRFADAGHFERQRPPSAGGAATHPPDRSYCERRGCSSCHWFGVRRSVERSVAKGTDPRSLPGACSKPR